MRKQSKTARLPTTRRPRRIAIVSGSRADYGLLHTVMRAVDRHPRLCLQAVACGMHLLPRFGRTLCEIEADGWRVDATVRMQAGDDSGLDQSVGLSKGVAGIARYLERAATDVVVVLGDRIEAMAAALAAVTTGRFLAHIHGGDVAPGDQDEGLRHAITKLAHLHFAATALSARRIMRMGERPDTVFNVGAPGLDDMLAVVRDIARNGCQRLRTSLILQHPSGRSPEQERRVMASILRAVQGVDLTPTVIYPNSDRGHTGIIEAIAHARRLDPRVHVYRSLPRDEYLRLLCRARVLVGNSSSGIIEAASAGTSAVNVGARQAGRQRSGSAVIDCSESAAAIENALRAAVRKRPRVGGRNCYGEGRAGRGIARILAETPLDERLRRKRTTH